MIRKILYYLLVSIVITALGLSGCSPKAPTTKSAKGVTGSISVSNSVVASLATIGPNGGSITVNQPESPIYGLEITLPQGAYSDTKQIQIEYSQVEKHTFGELFNPITPLISVTNCEQYAEDIIEVRVPVTVPSGSFAMGFYYDSKKGTLEGIPLVAVDENSITLGTRHFSDFIISVIDIARLKKNIQTDFSPGRDDWQIPNPGSYIEPGGYCSGATITALWYFDTKPDGAGVYLHGRYDNNGQAPMTPGFWEDDSLAIRLASVVQEQVGKGRWFSYNFWSNQRGLNDELTWNLFAYSLQITGQPQLVGIGNDTKSHSMICYGLEEGNLLIADPNSPGILDKRIAYSASKFSPYDNGTVYDKIGYRAKSSVVDWSYLAPKWSEFKEKTIGNDKFPPYVINYKDNSIDPQSDANFGYRPLNDGFKTKDGELTLTAWTNSDVCYLDLYRNGKFVSEIRRDQPIKLEPGDNKLGFYVYGMSHFQKYYMDFKYINVIFALATATASSTATKSVTSARPIVTNFEGPSKLEFDSAFNVVGLYTFKVTVQGGTPPYYYVWQGAKAPQVMVEGNQYDTIKISPQDMRQPGAISDGFFVWVTVKDSKDQYATFGLGSPEYMYGLKFTGKFDFVDDALTLVKDTWEIVKEP